MPSVFTFETQTPSSKVFVTSGQFPSYIDPKQPPTKKSPFRQIQQSPFLDSVTIVLPDTLHNQTWPKLSMEIQATQYAKVFLKLQDLLEGEFFSEYIKKGNVLMLSEGQPGVDCVFYCHQGVLRMELPRKIYEKAGLQGKPVRSGARKHISTRFLVECDLRQSSMVHGKKGFERIVWAAKNVLDRSLLWLFVDLGSSLQKGDEGGDGRPIDKYHPQIHKLVPKVDLVKDVIIPPSLVRSVQLDSNASKDEQEESLYELQEWLDLVCLGSPCVTSNVAVDHNISRYSVYEPVSTSQNLRVIKWEGLISSDWMVKLLISVIRHLKTIDGPQWLAMTATTHQLQAIGQIDGYSIILNSEYASQTSNTDNTRQDLAENADAMDTSSENSLKLVRYLCFEHADSIT